LKDDLEDIDDLHNYFITQIIDCDEDELKTNQAMLQSIGSLRYWLNMFALPDELLTPAK
jgi:hypothetical protein